MYFDQILQAMILGILQGLTELLPISSSAHLILLPWILDWEHLGIAFDVVLHGGTMLAILVYFYKDWKQLARSFFRRFRGFNRSSNGQMDLAILAGTLPAILVALACRSMVENYARQPVVIVMTLTIFGLLLAWADRRGKGNRTLGSLTPGLGLLIGLAQAIALVPGVSRSGVTITAALLLGFSRTDSARFSFLLSGPIVALATLKGIYELASTDASGSVLVWSLVVGIATSFVTGLLCIKYFLRFLRTKTLIPFVIYRLGLAAVIVLLMMLH
jgi:undecaprenyl-diphosphatase